MSRLRWVVWLLVVLLAGCTSTVTPTPGKKPRADGPRIAAFKLLSAKGESIEYLPGSRYEVTVVAFSSSTWNPDHAAQWRELADLHRKLKERGLRIIAVAYDEKPETVRKWSSPGGFEVAVGDQKFYDQFALAAIPTLVVISPQGDQAARVEGYASAETLQGLIEPYLP